MIDIKLLPKQWEVFQPDPGVDYDIKLYQGGVGCVDGDTLIDLWSGEKTAIKNFNGGYIKAWDGKSIVKALATKPAVYDTKPLYRVRTANGREIICTVQHRFLTASAWVRTCHLKAGDALLVSPSSLNQCLTESVIESIEYVKQDYYYDLHVPGYNNYLAQGFVNHNSGKTFLGSLTGLSVLAANPGATWLVGADTYARLKITTCETYEELLDGAKVRYKHNKTDHIIKIPGWDDARVIFKGVDDPQALRSVNGIGGHLEEASLITEASYLEFLGRLRQAKAGDPIRIILTTNPQAQKGWLYTHFVDNAGVVTQEIRGNQINVSQRRVIARTLDNPHVSDAYIASLKNAYDEELWKIMVLGQDGDYTRGLVSYNFNRDINVRETGYKPDLTTYLSCDFNVDPMSWVLAHRYNGEYHFFDEVVIENTNINECVDEVVARYPKLKEGKLILTGDASGGARNVQNDTVGGTSYTQMDNRFIFHGWPKPIVMKREKNPPPPDRFAAWNSMMRNTNGVSRIFMDPRCKWLINNCENLKYKDGSSQVDEPTSNDIKKDHSLKFTKHIFDAASYLVEYFDPVVLRPSDKQGPSVSVANALNKHLRGR